LEKQIQGGRKMNKKNVLFGIVLFVITALSSTYYFLDRYMLTIAQTTYRSIPLILTRIIFSLVWGNILFALIYFQSMGVKSGRRVRVTIEAVFLLANIFSLYISFYNFGTFSSYTLILTGLLFAVIIFEIIQVCVSKRKPASPTALS